MEQNPTANKFAVKKRIFGIALRTELLVLFVLVLAFVFREPLTVILRASLFAPCFLVFHPAVAAAAGAGFWFLVQSLIGLFGAMVFATVASRVMLGITSLFRLKKRETRLRFSVFCRAISPAVIDFFSEQNKNLAFSVLIR